MSFERVDGFFGACAGVHCIQEAVINRVTLWAGSQVLLPTPATWTKHIVVQLLNRVVAPELLREVGTHVGPFCKWQGANTDDLPNQGVRIEKAADWLELCQRLFPVRDEMVAGTLVVVIVGIVVDRTLHTVYACECPQEVRVHLLASLLHSRTLSTLVVASLGVHHFDSATCDHSRHRQFADIFSMPIRTAR